jgi:hypothetical protein
MTPTPTRIPGTEKIEALLGVSSFVCFTNVVDFNLTALAGTGRREYRLDLVLQNDDPWKPTPGRSFRVNLRFDGVKGLRLPEIDGPPDQITGLVIDDVSHRQLEGIRFHVSSCEGEEFNLLCRSAEVMSVERVA